jgi:hypothetical protein
VQRIRDELGIGILLKVDDFAPMSLNSLQTPSNRLAVAALLAAISLLVGSTRLALDKVLLTDVHIHVRWGRQMYEALSNGVLYPRWMPEAFGGLGEPAFLYYSPIFYYLASLLNFALADIWVSMTVLGIVALWLGGLVVYVYLDGKLSQWLCVLVASCAIASPFLFFMLNGINYMPWHASFPLALLVAVLTLSEDGRAGWVSLRLSLSLAALVMTHILSAFVLLLCLPIVFLPGLLASATRGTELRRLRVWLLSATLGLALSSIYLIPATTTWDLLSSDTWNSDRSMGPQSTFLFPVINSIHWPVLQLYMPATIAVSLLVPLFCSRHERKECRTGGRAALQWWLLAVAGLLLSTELIYPMLQHMPLLNKIDEPYRFFYLTALAAPIAAGLACRHSWSFANSGWPASIGKTGAVALMVAAPAFTAVLGVDLARNGASHLDARTDNRFGLYQPAAKGRSEEWRAYLDAGSFAGECERARMTCTVLHESSERWKWRISVAESALVRLPIFAFPFWEARIDGRPIHLGVEERSGLLAADLPSGQHEFEVYRVWLREEKLGFWMSAVAIVLSLAVIAVRASRRALRTC